MLGGPARTSDYCKGDSKSQSQSESESASESESESESESGSESESESESERQCVSHCSQRAQTYIDDGSQGSYPD